MKVYFTAAIYQSEKFLDKYKRIVDLLKKHGCEVLEDTTITSLEEAINKSDSDRIEYYKKVIKWIDKSDLVVAEASFPSTLSIGHEITLALEKNRPVIVLYLKGKEPAFLLGLQNEKIIWVKYDDQSLGTVLSKAIDDARCRSDVRFNFFVNPKILAYLDWIAQKRMVPRSVFLRNLIEREMKKDKEFKQ